MKKIGILTLNGYFNYGNRLQNYALQEILKSLGFEVETIINTTQKKTNPQKNTFEKIEALSKFPLKNIYKKIHNKINNKLYNDKLNRIRTDIFKEFTCTYIKETDITISEGNIPCDFSDEYDYFVTGSDQVWNPYYRYGSSIDFLTFAPQYKRIAYAPSFGIGEIPHEYVEDYKVWLSEMHRLSVREEAGAEIIKKLTGRNSPVLIDPTLMLTKEDWLAISKVPSDKPLKRYMLTYFLGDIPKERMKQLKNIAKKNDLEIIHLAQIKDKVPYLSGPSEFIDYINSASVFCTDSFHGVVFSILLNTPFIVFSREGKAPSMNSRIETLLRTFKLESRSAENIQINDQIFDVDYSHTIPILKEERQKSLNYIKRALNINK